MVGLVIAFPQMVLVYKAGESKIDPNSIHIEVPVDVPSMSGTGNPQNSEQEQAEQALDKLFGEPAKSAPAPGDANAPAAGGATAPATVRRPPTVRRPRKPALQIRRRALPVRPGSNVAGPAAAPAVTVIDCASCDARDRSAAMRDSCDHRCTKKSPAAAGLFALRCRPACAYLRARFARCAAIMKLSKRFSATWNHSIWSARNVFHGP